MTRLRQRSITVWVPGQMHHEFRRTCRCRGTNMTAILRECILDCIRKAQEVEKMNVEQF